MRYTGEPKGPARVEVYKETLYRDDQKRVFFTLESLFFFSSSSSLQGSHVLFTIPAAYIFSLIPPVPSPLNICVCCSCVLLYMCIDSGLYFQLCAFHSSYRLVSYILLLSIHFSSFSSSQIPKREARAQLRIAPERGMNFLF